MIETDLVFRAQSGDRDAFRGLVERYATLTERTARALLADHADAEDAVQEAWLDAWRALPRFQAGREFRPWLLTLVANRCRMKARQRRPVTISYREEIGEMQGAYDEPAPSVRGTAWDEHLHSAMLGLDGDQRRMLELRYYADLQLEEIAALTDVPLGTVKSRLHRALAHLRSTLSAELAVEPA